MAGRERRRRRAAALSLVVGLAALVGLGGLTVLAGSPAGTAAGAAPTSFDSCTTIDSPGTYELSGDITDPSVQRHCIQIRSSDVVLDGGGHEISVGSSSFIDGVVADEDSTLQNVTVRDLTVTNLLNGLRFSHVEDLTVEDVTTGGHSTAISISRSSNVQIDGLDGSPSRRHLYFANSQDVSVTGSTLDESETRSIYATNVTALSIGNSEVSGADPATAYGGDVISLASGSTTSWSGVSVVGGPTLDLDARSVQVAVPETPPALPANTEAVTDYLFVTDYTPPWYADLVLSYDDAGHDESDLGLWRYDGGWQEVSAATVDQGANVASANVTTNGTYVVLESGVGGDSTPPTADAGADLTVDEDAQFSFDGTGSSDDVDVDAYEWDVDGDDATELTGPEPSHAFETPGTYPVELVVEDAAGNADADTVNVTVSDVTAPTANATSNATSVPVGDAVRFDGTASTDDVGVTSYGWTFGDGSDAGGATATHAFDSPGTYTVELVVRDAAGNSNTTSETVTVGSDSEPPSADAGPDTTVDEDVRFTFDGTASTDDVGVVDYEWDVDGDGSAELSGAAPSHTFADPGSYAVTLTVTDAAGNVDTDETSVEVRDVTDPVADVDVPFEPDVGERVEFESRGSTDNVDVVDREWDFQGDGEMDADIASPSHAFDAAGEYEVTLTVYDAAGNSDTDRVTVTVEDTSPPEASISADATSVRPSTDVDFDGSNSTDDGDIASYEWAFGDGTRASGATASHAFAEAGTYQVELTVTDTGGNNDTETVTVEVIGGDAAFADSSVQETKGDVARIPISLTNTRNATLTVGSPSVNYQSSVTVVDGNGDGTVVVRFNTYAAGSGTGETVFTTVADADSVGSHSPGASSSGLLEAGDYELALAAGSDSVPAGGTETGVGTLILEERSTGSIRVATLPDGARVPGPADLADLRDDSSVADGDRVVHEIDVSGIQGLLEHHRLDGSASDATGAFLAAVEGDELGFRLVETDDSVGTNDDANRLAVDSDRLDVVTDQSDDRLYLVYDLASGTDGTEYRSTFTVRSNSGLAAADETAAATWGLTERDVTLLPEGRIVVDSLENRTIRGESTLAPGTRLDLRARSIGGNSPFTKLVTPSPTVRPDGTFAGSFDFSDVPNGTEFSVTVSGGGVSDEADGIVVDGSSSVVRANAGDDRTVLVGSTVEFEGSALASSGNLTYEWEVDDNTTRTGQSVAFDFDETGTHTVTLTVTNENGAAGTDSAIVTVNPIEVDAGDDATVEVGTPVHLEGSASGGVGPLDYEWQFGGGTFIGSEASMNHTFITAGTYRMTLTVSDENGNTASDSIQVQVTESTRIEIDDQIPDGWNDTHDVFAPEVVDIESDRYVNLYRNQSGACVSSTYVNVNRNSNTDVVFHVHGDDWDHQDAFTASLSNSPCGGSPGTAEFGDPFSVPAEPTTDVETTTTGPGLTALAAVVAVFAAVLLGRRRD